MPDELVNVRCMVDDVDDAVAFYTARVGFQLRSAAAPAFADVIPGHARANPDRGSRIAALPMYRKAPLGAHATAKGA